MKKIAITLPDDQAAAIERIREKRRIPRSRVIQEAIALYLRARRRAQMDQAYVGGYRRVPEATEADGYAQAAAEVLEAEDWG